MSGNGARIVTLDVGGTKFSTTFQTLNSALQENSPILKSIRDGVSPLFFDRDPTHFRLLLNYMRDGSCPSLSKITQFDILEEIKIECDYYQLLRVPERLVTGIVSRQNVSTQTEEAWAPPAGQTGKTKGAESTREHELNNDQQNIASTGVGGVSWQSGPEELFDLHYLASTAGSGHERQFKLVNPDAVPQVIDECTRGILKGLGSASLDSNSDTHARLGWDGIAVCSQRIVQATSRLWPSCSSSPRDQVWNDVYVFFYGGDVYAATNAIRRVHACFTAACDTPVAIVRGGGFVTLFTTDQYPRVHFELRLYRTLSEITETVPRTTTNTDLQRLSDVVYDGEMVWTSGEAFQVLQKIAKGSIAVPNFDEENSEKGEFYIGHRVPLCDDPKTCFTQAEAYAAEATQSLPHDADIIASHDLDIALASPYLFETSWKGNPDDPRERRRICYMCKRWFTTAGAIAQAVGICEPCESMNQSKRDQRCDMDGLVAIVTGARIKIGHACALTLLRCGAAVVATSRFPKVTFDTFRQHADFASWEARLQVIGVNLNNPAAVEEFVREVKTRYDRIDILINNAAQTVARPVEYYSTVIEQEVTLHLDSSKSGVLSIAGNTLLDTPSRDAGLPVQTATGNAIIEKSAKANILFPRGRVDEDGQQLDLRLSNSWVQQVEEISAREMHEVQAVNSVAPFILVSQLRSCMTGPFDAFVVNVSSPEGQFSCAKNSAHVHTNMAKAALNMLTRTIASDMASDNIYVNSVDTGWITKNTPVPLRATRRECPLTAQDGAARVLDPILSPLSNQTRPEYGKFYVNFKPSPW